MLPIPFGNPLSIFSGFVSSAVGWAWDKVVQGVFTWFAEGLLLLIEFVWGLLDTATTPRLTDDWFANGLVATLAPIALFVTVAMMLMTAIQAGLSGRPELIVDAVVSAARALFATALTVVAMDTLIRFGDVIADAVWVQARPNTREVLDGLVAGVLGGEGWGATFLGPLALLLGMIGMLVTTILLFMRSTLLYLVAAFAPLVWSSSILPMMRGGVRRMVHLAVALVLAKPAIVISLAIGMQLIASAGDVGSDSGNVAGVGTLLTGFFCFAVSSISPWVVYKLLPAAEGAAVSSGVVGGWSRGAMTAAQAGMMVKSMGAAKAASAATKAIPTPGGGEGSTGFSAPSSGGGGGGGRRWRYGPGRAGRVLGGSEFRRRLRRRRCRCGRWSGGTRRGRGRRCVDGSQDGHERRHVVDIGGVRCNRVGRCHVWFGRCRYQRRGVRLGWRCAGAACTAAGGDLVVAFCRSR